MRDHQTLLKFLQIIGACQPSVEWVTKNKHTIETAWIGRCRYSLVKDDGSHINYYCRIPWSWREFFDDQFCDKDFSVRSYARKQYQFDYYDTKSQRARIQALTPPVPSEELRRIVKRYKKAQK